MSEVSDEFSRVDSEENQFFKVNNESMSEDELDVEIKSQIPFEKNGQQFEQNK